ncbi:conserved hypothetical protein [Coccidioides posadasii str. Silveira]|uniref:Uncharacterized protein n=1 Tax=Coccidioides posadasii (strain RMSCC 757 / Silveira) TaxID=443226 RepID=E9D023_COCPS|nr:conserved hypothetical protein [Coccidioides posadasii str. Silveira]
MLPSLFQFHDASHTNILTLPPQPRERSPNAKIFYRYLRNLLHFATGMGPSRFSSLSIPSTFEIV